jgi:hypothetical protein
MSAIGDVFSAFRVSNSIIKYDEFRHMCFLMTSLYHCWLTNLFITLVHLLHHMHVVMNMTGLVIVIMSRRHLTRSHPLLYMSITLLLDAGLGQTHCISLYSPTFWSTSDLLLKTFHHTDIAPFSHKQTIGFMFLAHSRSSLVHFRSHFWSHFRSHFWSTSDHTSGHTSGHTSDHTSGHTSDHTSTMMSLVKSDSWSNDDEKWWWRGDEHFLGDEYFVRRGDEHFLTPLNRCWLFEVVWFSH